MNTLEINVFCRKSETGAQCEFDVVRGRVSVPHGDAVRWHADGGRVTVTFPEGSPFDQDEIIVEDGESVLTPLSKSALHKPYMAQVSCEGCPTSMARYSGPQIIVER